MAHCLRKVFGDIPAIRCSHTQVKPIFLDLITKAAQAATHGDARITPEALSIAAPDAEPAA